MEPGPNDGETVPDLEEILDDNQRRREGTKSADIIRGSFWTLVMAVVGVPASFAVNLLLARTLGPAGLGTFSTYIALAAVLSTVLNLGVAQATVQHLVERQSHEDVRRRNDLVRNCVGFHALIEGPVLAATIAVLLRRAEPLIWVGGSAAILITQILGTAAVLLTATLRNARAAQLALISNLVTQASVVAIAIMTRSPTDTFAVQLGGGGFAALICYLAIESDDRRLFYRPILFRRLPPGFFSFAVSACGSSLVAMLVYGRSEIFVLEATHRRVSAGLFALATGLASQITIPMDSVMGPLAPNAAALLSQSPDRAPETAERTVRLTSLLGAFTMCAAIPFVFTGVVTIFGFSFRDARVPFLLLGAISCAQSVQAPLSTLIYASRDPASVLRINVLCMAFDAALALTLIPVIGLWGAVIANAAAQAGSLTLLTRAAVRRFGISTSAIAAAGAPAMAGVVAGGAGVLVSLLAQPNPAIAFLAGPLTGLSGLVLALRASPTLRMSDSDATLIVQMAPVRFHRPLLKLARGLGLAS
jgi:O-antigen/teichoic acid export membrane protein